MLLRGRIRGPSGRALGGLEVDLGIYCARDTSVGQLELRTDAAGAFTASIPRPDGGHSLDGGFFCKHPKLSGSRALLSIRSRDHVAWESWHELEVRAGVVDLGDILLPWGGRIEGTVSADFAFSDPQCWTVSVFPLRPELPRLLPRATTGHARPDFAGAFALTLVPPGPAKVIVSHDLLGELHEELVEVADNASRRRARGSAAALRRPFARASDRAQMLGCGLPARPSLASCIAWKTRLRTRSSLTLGGQKNGVAGKSRI